MSKKLKSKLSKLLNKKIESADFVFLDLKGSLYGSLSMKDGATNRSCSNDKCTAPADGTTPSIEVNESCSNSGCSDFNDVCANTACHN